MCLDYHVLLSPNHQASVNQIYGTVPKHLQKAIDSHQYEYDFKRETLKIKNFLTYH